MPKPRRPLDVLKQGDEVLKRLKTEPSGVMRERLLAVSLGLKGELTLSEIAGHIGRSRAIIQIWFDRYRSSGIAGLEPSKARRGFASRLHPQASKELKKKLAKGSFRRADDARIWLEKRFGIAASASRVRFWLGKLGARLKVVRPRHPNSSESKRFAFRNQLARQIFNTLVRARPGRDWKRRPMRIWVADEARFGLQPSLRRAWVTRGVRAHKSSRCRYDWQYIWAALQIGGGGSEFFYSDKADADMSGAFLRQIARRDPLSIHVVIWDGAGFHPPNGDGRIPGNVVVLRQPPYSPELNPVERLWDQLRDGLCNRSWQNLEELLAHATRWLREFWGQPRRILSLVGDGWMRLQVNA
jgi:transposase